MSLPSLPQKDNYRREVRTEWGGLNLNENAGDGELIEALNMSSREYPLLATARFSKTRADRAMSLPFAYAGRLGYQYKVGSDYMLYDPIHPTASNAVRHNAPGETQYAILGHRMCIFPSKQMYDFELVTMTDMETSFNPQDTYLVSFQDGTYKGVAAEMNTIYCPGAKWAERFSVGDAIEITGTQHNNMTPIIREIEGDYLRFDEGIFTEELVPELYLEFPNGIAAGTFYTDLNGEHYQWTQDAIVSHVKLGITRFSWSNSYFVTFDAGGSTTATEMTKTNNPTGTKLIFSGVTEQYIYLRNGLAAGSYNFTKDGSTYYSFTTGPIPADTTIYLGYLSAYYIAGNPPMMHYLNLTTGTPQGTELTVTSTEYRAVLARTVPDMDYVCVNENRVWGCKGDTIYCSKLGDPLNWNVFDELSTDSWTVETGTPGDFTGCCSFQGYPTFFKENAVFKVLGDTAQNFTLRKQSVMGVYAGAWRSIVEIRGLLYYLSQAGVMAWNGGDYPTIISGAIGLETGQVAAGDVRAGTDAIRYYIETSPQRYEREIGWWVQQPGIYVYDTRYGTWHKIRKESGEAKTEFAGDGTHNWMLKDWEDGVPLVYALHSFPALEDTDTEWAVTFADSTRAYKTALTGSESKKGVLRLLIRCRLAGSMKVWIAYDGGEFEQAGEFGGEDGLAKTSKVVPLILRRCDFWQLRLTGVGDAVIYSIAVERYGGEWQQA